MRVMHAPNTTPSRRQIYVWDLFVRIFHWTLVAAFSIAYLTEDPLVVHVWAGYVVGALVAARVFWGFIGPKHARFSDFIYSPAGGLRYTRDLISVRAKRYLGHSPGGGTMVLALLVFLAATVVTGLVVYGGDQQAGPLSGMFSKETGEAVEELHELVANITLALIFFHVAGVALASFAHHENLLRAMITGYKRPNA
jgi:cytochrome b